MGEHFGQPEHANLSWLLELAKQEDLGSGDITSALLEKDVHATGRFVARQELTLCGAPALQPIADAYHSDIRTELRADDAQKIKPGEVLATWSGPAQSVLSAERVALNFLQRLSGIATLTRRYVDAIEGTGAVLCDTRKTTPGWRRLEKYAVRCGGGTNHRMGLYDAVLVKDNHLAICAKTGSTDPLGDLAKRFDDVRSRIGPHGFVEIEVDTLEQLERALQLGPDIILLDNMNDDELRTAVKMRNDTGQNGKVALEASGGVTLQSVRAVGETGVERIAVGAVTHSAIAVDIALDIHLND